MAGRIGAEAGQIDDRIFRLEAFQLLARRADQHRADEEIVPGELVDHADANAVLGLRAAEKVLDEQGVLLAERGEEIGLQCRELIRVDRLVIVPPDRVLGLGIADDELVLGGAAGVLAGLDDERPILGKRAFATRHGLLDELRRAEIPVQSRGRADALKIQTKTRDPVGHLISP